MLPKPKIILYIFASVFIAFFFSYKLLDVPMGFTADESAFGYNAALLAHSGRDENNRFLPFFVLSVNGTDWRQPVTQYYLALLFRIFGASLFLLRFSSIIITVVSFWLIIFLARLLYPKRNAFLPGIIFLTIPLIMIQSHMGLDNIMPIPFTLIWLITLILYRQKPRRLLLVISALSLGISFYTYKGMRAIVPVWFGLALIYLWQAANYRFSHLFHLTKVNFSSFLVYTVVFSPFMLAVPFLNHYYPGSILGGSSPSFDYLYNFLYPYLSSFDLTFLFIKGDATPYHSTGLHGMFLLATLPLFILGIYASFKQSHNHRFILFAFFLAPLLYGAVNSVHRASRLMCLIPLFTIISTSPFYYSRFRKYLTRPLILVFSFLFLFNYFDFLKYYFTDYRKFTQNIVGDLKNYLSYQELLLQSQKLNLVPYVSSDLQNGLYESIYFPSKVNHLHQDLTPPGGSILLTNRAQIPGMTPLNISIPYYYLQTTP